MALIAEGKDEEIRRLLVGNEEELARAFERLDTEYRPRFQGIARRRFPRLSADDFADAWQDALKDLLQTRRSGRLSVVRRVFAWLWTVFHRRLQDQAQESDKRRRSPDSLLRKAVQEALIHPGYLRIIGTWVKARSTGPSGKETYR